jgi:hypothetical protein
MTKPASAARRRGAASASMPCQATSTPDGYRCQRCRIAWDRDETRDCAIADNPEPVFSRADVEAVGRGLRRLKRARR